jgi:Leucine-rich repeat (LRR) protein
MSLKKRHSWRPLLGLALLFILPLGQAATDCAVVTEIPTVECEALIALYDSTDGENWRRNTGWNVTNMPCSWYGIECHDGHVTILNIQNNGLSGSIPTELGNLSRLGVLYLSRNQLSGSIPTELGNLSRLEELYLSENQLSGSIPAELGNLSNLNRLYLGSNELCGNIPLEFLNSNARFNLYHNHLTTSDPALIAWLEQSDPNWATTQTGCLGFFTTLNVKVAENAGTVTLTVSRGGDTNGTLEVDYATTDGTALDGIDYVGATGRLTWLDGDTSNKTLTITLIDDTVSEYVKTFTVTLSDLTSGDNLETATVIIIDDEPTDCALVTVIPEVECEALIALYDSTDGENWSDNTGWNVTNTPCSWYQIRCDGGHVTVIDLPLNGLSGSIPAEMGNLINLETLYLADDQLSGSIPAELGNLSNLRGLYLHNTQLSGSIPRELGNLINLEILYLSNNQLSGSIPAELGNLSNLKDLYLSNNQLNGFIIPTELGNLSKLGVLDLSHNQLSGSIPAELANLYYNTWIKLNNNELCGNIPLEFLNRSSDSGFESGLIINHNHLTASDPALIAWLDEHDPNWATTQTPCQVPGFTTSTVKVAENAGTVTLTVRRGGDTNGTLEVDYATADDTALEGTDYVGATGRLIWLDGDSSEKTLTITLIDNSTSEGKKTFTVTLSAPISGADLESASVIIKDDEPICAAVTEIPELECEALIALYDSIDGENWNRNMGWNVTITPCSWYGIRCDGGHVTELSLWLNRLSGSIPTELGNLSNLELLHLFHNHQLSGSIPSELGNLIKLDSLYLNNNQLSGSIPAELGNLSQLKILYLSNNQLNGSIPTELGNLSNLERLVLDNNELCGNIPTSFLNLNNMWRLNLGHNHLTASDPALIAWLDEHDPDWATTQTPCSAFGFTTPTVEVAENAGTVTLTVRRGGDINGTLEVDYATADGTALEGTDYVGATGRLTWLDGDTSEKTLTITLIDNTASEDNKTFTIILSDPTSGADLETATVIIRDDDPIFVSLADFTATALETTEVRLEWQTAIELDNAGFHIWRATGEGWKSGDYSTVIRLTARLIPAQGNSSLYSYIDADVSTYVTYYYGLEDIDLYGQSTFHWDFIESATAK